MCMYFNSFLLLYSQNLKATESKRTIHKRAQQATPLSSDSNITDLANAQMQITKTAHTFLDSCTEMACLHLIPDHKVQTRHARSWQYP